MFRFKVSPESMMIAIAVAGVACNGTPDTAKQNSSNVSPNAASSTAMKASDDTQICTALIDQGLRDTTSTSISRSNYQMIHATVCDARYSKYQQAQQASSGGGLDIIGIFGVDASQSNASSVYEERWSKFCSAELSEVASTEELRGTAQIASTALLNSFNRCIDSLRERFIRIIQPMGDGAGFIIRLENKRAGNQRFQLTGLVIADITDANPTYLDPRRQCRDPNNNSLRLPLDSGTLNQLTITCVKQKSRRVSVSVTTDAGNPVPVEIPESPQPGPGILERLTALEGQTKALRGRVEETERADADLGKGLKVDADGNVTIVNDLIAEANKSPSCRLVELNQQQRDGNDRQFCPDGFFLVGVDVDDTSGPGQSSPLPARVKCCRP